MSETADSLWKQLSARLISQGKTHIVEVIHEPNQLLLRKPQEFFYTIVVMKELVEVLSKLPLHLVETP